MAEYHILSTLVLLTSFVLMANKRTTSYIRTFRFQSLLIAMIIGRMALERIGGEGFIELAIILVLILGLKVWYIPNLLLKTHGQVTQVVEKDFYFNIPSLVIVSTALVAFLFLTLRNLGGTAVGIQTTLLVNSLSVILIGFLFIISRKKAIGQIVGFLSLENGLFLTGILTTKGMPVVVELGIFADLLTAVLIMGVMVFRMNELFDSVSTDKLNRLRG